MKLSVPTAGVDDRTDDCACGADDVAVPAKVQISTFSDDRLHISVYQPQSASMPALIQNLKQIKADFDRMKFRGIPGPVVNPTAQTAGGVN